MTEAYYLAAPVLPSSISFSFPQWSLLKRNKLIINFLLACILGFSQCELIFLLEMTLEWEWRLKGCTLRTDLFWWELFCAEQIAAKPDCLGQSKEAIYSHFVTLWSLDHRHHNLLRYSNILLFSSMKDKIMLQYMHQELPQNLFSSDRWITAPGNLMAWVTHTFWGGGDEIIESVSVQYSIFKVFKWQAAVWRSWQFLFQTWGLIPLQDSLSPNPPYSLSPHLPAEGCYFL